MENEKSDIKKGWVTGSIDLGKLNKAHQRFSFNELNPKTLNCESKSEENPYYFVSSLPICFLKLTL